MSIIKKLGIGTPNKIETVGDVSRAYELSGIGCPSCHAVNFFKDGERLKEILDGKNEMLEALIANTETMIKDAHKNYSDPRMSPFWATIEINGYLVEKATNKSWEEIKEILND